jgi:hypothetical protein
MGRGFVSTAIKTRMSFVSVTIKIKIQKTIICSSLALTEEHRCRMFENRALRRIFGSERQKTLGGWRKLHNEKHYNLYSYYGDQMKEYEIRNMRDAYKILVGKPEMSIPLGGPGYLWEDNIKTDLKELMSESVIWI